MSADGTKPRRAPHHKARPVRLLGASTPAEAERLAEACAAIERTLRHFLREFALPIATDDTLDAATVAALLDIEVKTLHNKRSDEEAPPCFRWHGRLRFPVRALAAWMTRTGFPLGTAILRWRES